VKVFVTGATGFVGQEVLHRLHQAHHSIRILARSRNSPLVRRLQAEYRLEVQDGDVLRPESLTQAMNETQAVIHLVGIISQAAENAFENIHLRGTQNVLAAAKQAGVQHFAHMSALGTRPNAVSLYHQTKWAAEEEVRRSGLPYTIFRPSLIFGPRDQFVNLFARMSRFSPVLPVMGNGRARFQPVAVEVVAAAFTRCLTEPASVGLTLDLCGPETFSFNQILDVILQTMGRRRLLLHIPLSIARIQAAVLEWVFPKLLHQAPPLNRDQLVMLQEDNFGNSPPATELLGLPRVKFREGIQEYLARRPLRPLPASSTANRRE